MKCILTIIKGNEEAIKIKVHLNFLSSQMGSDFVIKMNAGFFTLAILKLSCVLKDYSSLQTLLVTLIFNTSLVS